jgi:ABC-2 type transport system permease protein
MMQTNTKSFNSPLLKIAWREVHRIGERKTLYSLTIFLPIILFILLALIYIKGVVRELPVIVFDADNSEISRMLVRGLDATSSMHVYKYTNSMDEIKHEFMKGNTQGAFYIPKGMEADLKSGKKSTVMLFKNTSNLIVGNLLYKDGMTLVKTISAGILLKKFKSAGMNDAKAMTFVNPIRLETHPMYNPNYNYVSYLLPGLIGALLQMIIMVAGVLVISSEFTHNTFGELLEISKNNVLTILVGKSIPHLAIHLATLLGVMGIIFPLFSIEINGSISETILLSALFILAAFFPAMLISSFFHEQLFATEMALFVNTPAFIFSGFTFPLWSMPVAQNVFAQIIPFTHFLTAFIKIYQMKAPLRYASSEITILSIFFVLSFILTLVVLKYQMNKFYKKEIKEEGVAI